MQWRSYGGRGAEAKFAAPMILEADEFACAFCKGTGVTAKTHSRCPVCSGQRSVKVTPPAILCVYCRGRGEAEVRSGITCTVCHGKGAVSVREPIEGCTACRGRGATGGGHLPCTACRGTGVVTVKSR
jgi:RecJ-like exonuclease